MTAFVSDFLINPVLRQARRFSEISRRLEPEANPTTVEQAVHVHQTDCCDAHETHTAPMTSATAEGPMVENAPPATQDAPLERGAPPAPRAVPRHGKSSAIPEDDGHGAMRRRLQEIQRQDIGASAKAQLMHHVLMESYNQSHKPIPEPSLLDASNSTPKSWSEPLAIGAFEALKLWPAPTEQFNLTDDDVRPTYSEINPDLSPTEWPRPIEATIPEDKPRHLGCQHYLRNVKLQCSTCSKWYTCRFCHDAVEDHSLIRHQTRNMLCMLCATPQRASETCIKCGVNAARYYCGVCKLWDDHPDKPIYHCADCGICRRGVGLGKDFFHCKKCRACISMGSESSHRCIERSTDCNCPICGEYLFTSQLSVVFMRCGHSIHEDCYKDHLKQSYKCPICNKSLCNMDPYFRNLDASIQRQPMPEEYRDVRAVILCNDCSARSSVPFHWLGLKCSVCQSYNTVELEMIGPQGGDTQEDDIDLEQLEQVMMTFNRQIATTFEAAAGSQIADLARRHTRQDNETRGSVDCPASGGAGVMDTAAASQLPTPFRDDDDSDDDILGFWGPQSGSDNEADTPYDSEEDDEEDEEDEDDDDVEDELNLIGHR